NQFLVKNSKPLERIGVREMGRRSLSKEEGCDTLGSGQVLADFQTIGIKLSRKLEFQIAQTGAAKLLHVYLSIQDGIPSGPGDFVIFILDKRFSTWSTNIMYSSGIINSPL
ncbi:MAG: hypothetical protein ABF318_09465, partial [Ketobacter sp.]